MKRKWMTRMLALALVLSMAPTVGATAAERHTVEAVALAALGVMEGDAQGELHLDKTVTRAEFAKMLVAASTQKNSATGESVVSPYYDVPASHWAAGYVATARDLGLVKGYLDGLYYPNRTILLEEGVTMVLRLLGYNESNLSGSYPEAQLSEYRHLGLDEGIVAQKGQALTRKDCQQLFYHLMTTNNSAGVPYLSTLGYPLTGTGEINLPLLIQDATSSPVVATADWKQQIPFSMQNAVVYRNGKMSTVDQICAGDVLYWAESMRTIWSYRERVSGTVTAVSPSVSAPTEVTVSGASYRLGTVEAALQFSTLGQFGKGDTVTLLLGQDDVVVAVEKQGNTSETLYGVVGAVQVADTVDSKGNVYQSDLATVIIANGTSYAYPVKDDAFEVGDLVQVVVRDNGIVVSEIGKQRVAGKVDATKKMLGSEKMATNIKILDIYEGTACTVDVSRLDGVKLSKDDVLFYVKNANDEIEQLFLKDVTGENHQYGILTEIVDQSYTHSTNKTYCYLQNGISKVWSVQGGSYAVKEDEGVQMKQDGLYAMQSVKLNAVNRDGTAVGAKQSYLLANEVGVYEYRDGNYYASSLDRLQDGTFALTGWYDKDADQGGRIRIIVAR